MKPDKPLPLVIWLSVIHVLYLFSLPTIANFVIAPTVHDQWYAGFWFGFGLIGVPIAFAGMMSFNPFPRDPAAAFVRTFLLPAAAGGWWWYKQGTLLEYFAVMLVFEFMAIYLSLILMSFIPLKYYDPYNPRSGSARSYFSILIAHVLIAGGFVAALVISIWPWAMQEPFWQHPVTYLLLLLATMQYLISNFRLQLSTSEYRWKESGNKPHAFPDNDVSIEGLLLLAPLPWILSFWFITY